METKQYIEPEYLQLSKTDKIDIKKKLLIFPTLCVLFLLTMLLGELFPSSFLPSFTKSQYFFAANNIAKDLCDGQIDNILSHNMNFFNNHTINYSYYGGTDDIYNNGMQCFTDFYETSLKDNLVIPFIGNIRLSSGSYLLRSNNQTIEPICSALGYIYVNGEDVAQIDIQFISPDKYYVFVAPTTNSVSEDLTVEEQKVIEDYLNSAAYKNLNQASKYTTWAYNILSSQNHDSVKYLNTIFTTSSTSPTLIYQFLTNAFSNQANYYNTDFDNAILTNYQQNLAWMLYGLSQEVKIESALISTGKYNSQLHGMLFDFVFYLKSTNGAAVLTIPTIYTTAGYQIITDNVSCIAEDMFTSERIKEFMTFVHSDIMPEDLLIAKAAEEIKKTQSN